MAMMAAVTDNSTYGRLAAPFDHTFRDVRGGVELSYISGEQVVSRLNEVLGVAGWSFRVLEHAIHAEADEVWALGELTAHVDGQTIVRQQFGSQKLKRSRATGAPLDIGFDLKGAATDCMKKCASLLGVGLYLSRKEGSTRQGRSPMRSLVPSCQGCGATIKPARFKDGTTWDVGQLAGRSQRLHGMVLCVDCFRKASQAQQEQEVERVAG